MPVIDWSATSGGFELPAKVGQGDRNDTMHRYLSSLRSRGASDEQLEVAAANANAERFDPPLDASELGRIVRSVCTYDVGDGTWHAEQPKLLRPRKLPVVTRDKISTSVLPDLSGMSPNEQAKAWIRACFEEDDIVCLSRNLYYKHDDAYEYAGTLLGGCGYEALDKYLPHVDDFGMWACVNPLKQNVVCVDGVPDHSEYGRSKQYVASYRNALVECDELPMDQQLELMLWLFWDAPMLRAITYSGGKSYHCILRIDAANAAQYAQTVEDLYQTCENHGLKVDRKCSNPTRMTRIAGAERREKGRAQRLVWAYG